MKSINELLRKNLTEQYKAQYPEYAETADEVMDDIMEDFIEPVSRAIDEFINQFGCKIDGSRLEALNNLEINLLCFPDEWTRDPLQAFCAWRQKQEVAMYQEDYTLKLLLRWVYLQRYGNAHQIVSNETIDKGIAKMLTDFHNYQNEKHDRL